MNKNLTEIVYILDRSGSMAHLQQDTIGGYNSFIEKQRAECGEAVITTVLFDDRYEMIHDRADIKKVYPLTSEVYFARGMTALLDAVGKTIDAVGNRHKYASDECVPSKTIVVITTDGFENSSREYSADKVKKMIKHQKRKYGWEFLFLGANIDAVKTAESIGIARNRSAEYRPDCYGTITNFECVSNVVSDVRASRPVTADWKTKIEELMKNEKNS